MRTMFGTAVTIAVNPGFVFTPKTALYKLEEFGCGIPYHMNDATAGQWLGIDRMVLYGGTRGGGKTYVNNLIRDMIKLLEDKRSNPKR